MTEQDVTKRNGQLVGGCEITHELSDSGELKSMLEKAFEGEH